MTDITANEPPSWRVGDLPGEHEINLFVDDPIPLRFANGDSIPWVGTKATVSARAGGANVAIEIIVLEVAGKKFLCSLDFGTVSTPGYYKIHIEQVQAHETFTYETIQIAHQVATTDLTIRNV